MAERIPLCDDHQFDTIGGNLAALDPRGDEALAAVDAQARAKERQVQAEAQLEANRGVQVKLADFVPTVV